MAIDNDMIGSAGTLIAASLQTSGQYIQSSMLDMLEAGLGGSIGVLLYVIAAITAVLIIALGGHYKFGLWFLIGPALYYQVVAVRIPSSGARWEFGDRTHQGQIVRDVNAGVIPPSGEQARVSWVFSVWDGMSTEIVQGFVKSMMLTDVNGDISFLSRTQRFGSLFHMKVSDPELQKFIGLVTLNECQEYMALQLGSEDVNRMVHDDIKAKLRALENVLRVTPETDSYKVLRDLHEHQYFGNPPPALKPAYSCRDVWNLAFQALQNEATTLIARVAAARKADGLTEADIMTEMGQKFDNLDNPLGPDHQVNMMVRAVSARMLLEQVREVHPGLAQLSLTRHLRKADGADVSSGVRHFDVSEDLRYLAASYEFNGKGEYLSAMLALPYIQGMAQYFLALSFPFFALALVMPGKHHTFFTWMGLWFWVKSWDFGFAVVMILDKLLYNLLPHGPEIPDAMLNDPDGPALMFQEILKADPTYTINAYYNLLATAIAAVPVLTGLLVKRGGGAILDGINQGFHNFSGKIGGSMASYARSFTAQELAAGAEKSKVRAYGDAVMQSLADPEVLAGLGLKAWSNRNISALSDVDKRKFMQDVSKSMNSQTASFGKNLALAKFEANLAMAEWRETMSPQNMRRSELAVMMKYYNHDFISRDPYPALENLMIARMNFQMGGTVKGAIASGLKSDNGWIKVLTLPVIGIMEKTSAISYAVDGDATGDVRNRRNAPVTDPRRP